MIKLLQTWVKIDRNTKHKYTSTHFTYSTSRFLMRKFDLCIDLSPRREWTIKRERFIITASVRHCRSEPKKPTSPMLLNARYIYAVLTNPTFSDLFSTVCWVYRHRTNKYNKWASCMCLCACVRAVHAFHFKQHNAKQFDPLYSRDVSMCSVRALYSHAYIHIHKLFSLILFCYRHSISISRAAWNLADWEWHKRTRRNRAKAKLRRQPTEVLELKQTKPTGKLFSFSWTVRPVSSVAIRLSIVIVIVTETQTHQPVLLCVFGERAKFSFWTFNSIEPKWTFSNQTIIRISIFVFELLEKVKESKRTARHSGKNRVNKASKSK